MAPGPGAANTTGMVDRLTDGTRPTLLLAALLAACLSLLLGGCESDYSDKDIRIVQIQQFRAIVEETKEKPGRTLIIDARTADEYRAAHIEGARNIRAEQLRPESPLHTELAKYEQIIVYGADPASGTARSAVKRIMKGGQGGSNTHVLWFQGGMKFWRAAAFPLVETAPAEGKPVNISPNNSTPPPAQPQPLPPPAGVPR